MSERFNKEQIWKNCIVRTELKPGLSRAESRMMFFIFQYPDNWSVRWRFLNLKFSTIFYPKCQNNDAVIHFNLPVYIENLGLIFQWIAIWFYKVKIHIISDLNTYIPLERADFYFEILHLIFHSSLLLSVRNN